MTQSTPARITIRGAEAGHAGTVEIILNGTRVDILVSNGSGPAVITVARSTGDAVPPGAGRLSVTEEKPGSHPE